MRKQFILKVRETNSMWKLRLLQYMIQFYCIGHRMTLMIIIFIANKTMHVMNGNEEQYIEQYLDNVKDECVVTLGSIIYYVYGHYVSLYVCLSDHPSIHLTVCLSICLSVDPQVLTGGLHITVTHDCSCLVLIEITVTVLYHWSNFYSTFNANVQLLRPLIYTPTFISYLQSKLIW